MGKGSGAKALQRARTGDKPKRQSSSGIKFARELAEKNDETSLKALKSQLFADVDSFSKTGKVSEHTSSYRIIYKNGSEVVVRYKDGKEIILQDGKRIKNFQLTGISYIGKANGNQEFKDSLGFSSSDKNGQKIFESKNRFESYNKEIKRLFDPKTIKNAVRTNGVFHEGDTPKNIDPHYEYTVTKLNTKGEAFSSGRYFGKDLKSILKGYHYNGLWWDKKGAHTFFTITNPEKHNNKLTSADLGQRSKKKSTGTSKKSTTTRSTTKKSTSKKSTTKKSTTTKKPTSSPTKNTAAKPKVWERGKKSVVTKKKK